MGYCCKCNAARQLLKGICSTEPVPKGVIYRPLDWRWCVGVTLPLTIHLSLLIGPDEAGLVSYYGNLLGNKWLVNGLTV